MNISTTSCIAAQTPIRRVARSRLFLSGPKTMHTPWELIQDGLFFGLKTANEVSSISIRDQTLFAIEACWSSSPTRGQTLFLRPYSSAPAIPRAILSHGHYSSSVRPTPKYTRHRLRAISPAHDIPFELSVLSQKLGDHFLWRTKGLQSPNPIVHFCTRGQLAG